MAARTYNDDTAIDDLQPGDRLLVRCPCGGQAYPAWAHYPAAARRAPLRDLAGRFVCKRCGRRWPDVEIEGITGLGSQISTLWTWPPGGVKPRPTD